MEEILFIKEIAAGYWEEGRKGIARRICEKLNWRQINGRLKVVSCLEALRRMEERGLVDLPQRRNCGGYHEIRHINEWEVDFKEPEEEITGTVETMGSLHLELANGTRDEKLWRYLIQRYHYLGYRRSVGRYLRYFIYLGNSLVALVGFADAIYHHHLRDEYLGWDKETWQKNRHLVINNVRFLILPWVKVKNLASKILSIVGKQVQKDWERLYGYSPVLIETFVDIGKFTGTCYRAANWNYLGRTAGKGRRGLNYYIHNQPKDLYVYPLRGDYLKILRCRP